MKKKILRGAVCLLTALVLLVSMPCLYTSPNDNGRNGIFSASKAYAAEPVFTTSMSAAPVIGPNDDLIVTLSLNSQESIYGVMANLSYDTTRLRLVGCVGITPFSAECNTSVVAESQTGISSGGFAVLTFEPTSAFMSGESTAIELTSVTGSALDSNNNPYDVQGGGCSTQVNMQISFSNVAMNAPIAGNGKAFLSWTAQANADLPFSYTLQYKLSSGSWETYSDITTVNDLRQAAFTLEGLTNDISYDFRISATMGGQNSLWSSPVSVAPSASAVYDLTLSPPADYADSNIYIDGIAYTSPDSSSPYSISIASETAKTAVMYRYNSGIPVGMYVWKLTFSGGRYIPTGLPQFENLLSYHGFSIRVNGISGIRFKTGIPTATREALLSSSGLYGYRLVEYGTLVMDYMQYPAYPLVLGGAQTLTGKAYYTESGTVNDKIFETKEGRYIFTSVLTRLTVDKYKTNYAFRGYIKLTDGAEETVIYGPIVARSIYSTAHQVLDYGDFPSGSPSEQYVRKIIRDADSL